MGGLRRLVLISLLLLSFFSVAAYADSCGTLSASKTLTSDITTNGTCFTINASNIILDGAGFTIMGNGLGFGITIGAYSNVTIRNFANIFNFTEGIGASNTATSLYYNNTIQTSNVTGACGINLWDTTNNSIMSNTITAYGSHGGAITVRWDSTINTISHNSLRFEGLNGSGVLLAALGTNLVNNNSISIYGASYGIRITDDSGGDAPTHVVSNNTILTYDTDASGLYLGVYDDNVIAPGNIINSTAGPEIYRYRYHGTSSPILSITNAFLLGKVNFTSHYLGEMSIDVNTTSPADPSGKRNLSDYLTIANTTATDAYIDFNLSYIQSDAAGVVEDTIKLYRYNTSAGAWEVVNSSSVDTASNTVRSGNITGDWGLFAPMGDSYPAYSNALNVTPATFDKTAQLNFSITWTNNASSTAVSIQVNRSGTVTTYQASNMTNATRWNLTQTSFPAGTHYWRSNVTDVEGKTGTTPWYAFTIAKATPVINLTLNGTNGPNTITEDSTIWLNGSVVTGDSGATLTLFLDGVQQNSGTSVANLTTFATQGTFNISLNYTTSQNYSAAIASYFVTVISDSCGTLSASKTLWSNITTNGTCFAIGASNIVLDGNGFTITGNGSGYGISGSGDRSNITIKNFAGINNFSIGIVLRNIDDFTISNNTILCANERGADSLHSCGIYFSSSDNNILSKNVILALNGTGINFTQSTNNTLTGDSVNATASYELYIDSTSTDNRITNMLLMGSVNFTSHSLRGVAIEVNTTPPADLTGKSNLSDYLTIANITSGAFIDFNLSYIESEAAGVVESTILLYRFNMSVQAWQPVISSSVDTAGNTVRSGNFSGEEGTSFFNSGWGIFAPLGETGLVYSAPLNVTPATFDKTAQLNFSINWTTPSNITLAWFLVNRSGIITNYVGTNMTAGQSSAPTKWNLTLTDFPAGTHSWLSNATDYDGNANTAGWYAFTIAKATPVINLTLNGTNGPNTITEDSTIWLNGSVTTGDSDYTLEIFVDGTSKGTSTRGAISVTNTFSTPGDKRIQLNYTTTQNYTGLSTTYVLTVLDTTPPSWDANTTAAPATFAPTDSINFTINWTDNFNLTPVLFEVNRSGTLTLYIATNQTAANTNRSTLWNLTLTDFPAGTHYWRSNATDSQGNVNTTGWYGFTIGKATPTINLTLNGTAGNVTIERDSSIWLNGSLTTGDAGTTIYLWLDGSSKGSGTSINNYTTFATIGAYNISLNYTATQNYTDGMASYFVIVNDTIVPTVRFVNATAAPGALFTDGYYKAGTKINFTMTFSEAVVVTGTPTLQLELGTNDGDARYLTNSSATTLVFNYTVQSGDTSADLEYHGTDAILTLDASTIKDSAGNNAVLTLAAVNISVNQAIVIDTTAPGVRFVNATAAPGILFTDGYYRAGTAINFTVTFNETAIVTGTPLLQLELGVSDGNATYLTNYSATTLVFNYTVQAGDNSSDLDYHSTDALYLNGGTINDTAGNPAILTLAVAGISVNQAIVIDTTLPAWSAPLNVTPSSFNKAHTLNFSINWTDYFDVSTVWIEVNRSGTAVTYTASNSTGANTWNLTLTDFPAGTHYWRSNATDSAGNVNTTGWYAFTISKIAPTINLTLNSSSAHITVEGGSSIWLNGSVVTGEGGATLTLFLDGVQQSSGTSVANLTQFSLLGNFNISLNYTTSQNYTAAMTSYIVTVVDTTVPGVTNLGPIAGTRYYNTTAVTLSADVTDNVDVAVVRANVTWANGSVLLNLTLGTAPTYSAVFSNTSDLGVYNVTFFANDTSAYLNSTETTWFNVTEAPDTIPPAWSSASSYPTSPATYSESVSHLFNVTWTDAYAIATVLIEHNFAGTPQNYTVTTHAESIYYYNYSSIAVGTYVWRMYANDTTNNTNVTSQYAYNVTRATPTLTITNNTPASTTYGAATNVTCAASSGQVTHILYRNGTQITNSEAVVLAVGTWNYTCNSSQTANYTNTTATPLNIVISKAAPTLSLTLNGTAGAVTIDEDTAIWLNGSMTTGDSDYRIDLWVDSTHKGTGSSAAISNYTTFATPGTFNISLNYTATQNYSYRMLSYLVTVNDITPPAYSAGLNVTPSSFNKAHTLNFIINWTDNFNLTSAWFEVNRSGTVTLYIASNRTAGRTSASTLWNLTLTDFPAGTHYWRSNASDAAGNVNTTPWYSFTIAQIAPTLNLTLNGTEGNVTIALNSSSVSISIWLNGSVVTGDSGATVSLFLNGASKGSGTSVANLTEFLNPGIYSLTLNYTTTQNYSGALASYIVTVGGDSCGTLNASKTLWSNITTTGTCFTIGASNIILDGAGYTITGDGSGYGISSTGNFDNFTVRNFGGIQNFSIGVLLDGSNNTLILIYNNSITSKDTAIFFDQIIVSNISANTLSTTGSGGSGITLRASFSNTLDSNTITSVGNNSVGINMTQSISNILSNNIISVNGSGLSWGVGLFGSGQGSFTGSQISSANSYEIFTDSSGFSGTTLTNVVLAGTVNFTSHSISNVSIDVNTTTKPADSSGKHNLSDYLTLTNVSAGAYIDFNLSYAPSELSRVNKDSVLLYCYNTSAGSWTVVNSSSMDAGNYTMRSGNITSFPVNCSLFASFGDKAPVVLSHTPTATMTNSTVTLTATTDENATCRYSTTANTAYASTTSAMTGNTTTHTASLTGLTTAIHHYYVRCNSSLGIVSTYDYDASFTVIYDTGETPPPSGGGGGGGGAVVPPEEEEEEEEEGTERIRVCNDSKVFICHQTGDGQHELCIAPDAVEAHFEHGDYLGKCYREGDKKEDLELYQIIEDIIANIPINIPVNRPDTSLQRITIEVDRDYTRIEIIFKTGTQPPKGVTKPNRVVKDFIEIDHPEIDDEHLINATVDFKVEKSWLNEQNSTADDVALMRFSENDWHDLPTQVVNETTEHFLYKADSPGLSVYAVVLKQYVPPAPTGAATSGEPFRIWQPSFLRDYLPLIMTVIVSIFMVMISGYYVVYLRKQIFVKHMEEIREKSIYVFPDFETLPKSKFAYLGLIADTDVKTYLDHRQLNMHTLIAGGTGSGKTISGMVIVEELLNRGVSVVVFDPVGQWTGFLRKNEDRDLLKQYSRFSLKRSMAFDARILEIRDSALELDILPSLKERGLTIFKLDKLSPENMDLFIERSLERIHRADLPEEPYLTTLLVLDEVHRLLPKYGGRKAHIRLEQAVREFRKWGIGLLMVSQVLTDFKGAIRGNIGTEIQMRTRYEGDLKRVRERNGPKISRLVPKMPVGTALMESVGYNKGQPYFVDFRPPLHSPHKLTQKELKEHITRKEPTKKTPSKEEQLADFTKECKARGFDDERIKKELLSKGWDAKLIEQALKSK